MGDSQPLLSLCNYQQRAACTWNADLWTEATKLLTCNTRVETGTFAAVQNIQCAVAMQRLLVSSCCYLPIFDWIPDLGMQVLSVPEAD